MAARAVNWFGGPLWLALVFVGAGLALAGYYVVQLVMSSSAVRRIRARRRS